MSKPKVLGMEYGIEITRPWNTKMYEHNERVAVNMKTAIAEALNGAFNEKDEPRLRTIAKAICSYGHGAGYEMSGIYEDARRQLEMAQNHWLHEWCWPDLVKAGLVQDIPVKFVGYKN